MKKKNQNLSIFTSGLRPLDPNVYLNLLSDNK